MKLAFVNDTLIEGRGADIVIYELARRLGKKHSVYILCGKSNFKEENFKIINLGLEKLFTGTIKDFNYFSKISRLRKHILKLNKKYSFDIFNVYHAALNPAFKNLPTIVSWLGSPITNNPFRKIISYFWLRSLKNNKITITISKFLAKKLRFLKKVKIIPCGVSEEFKPTFKDKNYMLYVGRHEKHKNIGELIKLSKEINFSLKIAGYGPETRRLKNYAKKIKAPVIFLGKVSRKKLIKLYQECSFFVSATRWEGFGLIFIEAAACGKPSVAYSSCSIPEVIKNGKTGFLVKNYEQFQKAAERLIKNKKLRKKLGKNALRFSRNFNWDKIAKEYEKVFKNLK